MKNQALYHHWNYILCWKAAADVDVVEFAQVDLIDAHDTTWDAELVLEQRSY
jgi:hypothetical protein